MLQVLVHLSTLRKLKTFETVMASNHPPIELHHILSLNMLVPSIKVHPAAFTQEPT